MSHVVQESLEKAPIRAFASQIDVDTTYNDLKVSDLNHLLNCVYRYLTIS